MREWGRNYPFSLSMEMERRLYLLTDMSITKGSTCHGKG